MKQLVCEMCGSANLVKDGGVFVCQSCGCKYSVEEARKMMVEGIVDVQGTVKIDNTEQIRNYIELANKAEDRGNEAEAESYANKALEIDPNNWEALYIKGKASGWQSSAANNRLEEAIDCFTKAIENCENAERLEQLKNDIGSDVRKMSLAMISLRCNNFESWPDSDTAEAIQIEALSGTLRVINLLVSCGISVDQFKADAAIRMNAAAVQAWSKVWSDYTDGKPIQPTTGINATYNQTDHYIYCHPSKFDFERFVQKASACIQVIETAISLDNDDDQEDLSRYDFLLSIAPKIIAAKSVAFIAGGAYSNSKWVDEYTLTESAKTIWTNKIEGWKKAKAEAEKRISDKKAEEYWRSRSAEKESLEKEMASLKQEIENIPNSDEYKALKSSVADLGKRIEELAKKAKKLGLFAGKERKAIHAHLVEAKKQIAPYAKKIKELDDAIEAKKKRVAEIEQKLLYPSVNASTDDAPIDLQIVTDGVDVVLSDFGDNKIAVINAYRELTGLGLKEAKETVESAPTTLIASVSVDQAQIAKARLESAGADVTVVGTKF